VPERSDRVNELRKEYSSREEFETDRRRLWNAGGWLVRRKVTGREESRRSGTIVPELGSEFPWQLAVPISPSLRRSLSSVGGGSRR